MNRTALLVLRLGLGITYVWTGILILLHTQAWAGLMQPWAMDLLPVAPETALLSTGVLDIGIGILLLLGIWTWIAAGLSALHLLSVLIVTGITDVTVRDIGLLAASITLMLLTLPPHLENRLRQK